MVVTKIIATLPRVITSAGSKELDVEGGDSDTENSATHALVYREDHSVVPGVNEV